jgi:hypothetical protein
MRLPPIPGMEKLPRGWRLTPTQEITKFPTCRVHYERRLKPLRPLKSNGPGSAQEDEERTGSHYIRDATTGSTGPGSSRLTVNIESCPGGCQCLYVHYRRLITVVRQGYHPGPVTMGWCQALDPDSYNLMDDNESFGVFWCRQRGCKNYYST